MAGSRQVRSYAQQITTNVVQALRGYNLGAFKDWVDSGGPVDKPIEPEM
jgi:hypothetical protein